MTISNSKNHPKFAEMRFFFQALNELSIKSLPRLESDPFAARFLARQGASSTHCTIRLKRNDAQCTEDALRTAWDFETGNAHKLLRQRNTIPGLARVLRVSEQGHPGFVICEHSRSRTVEDLESYDIRLALDVVLQITMSFMRLLKERADLGICAFLPDARTVTVLGKDVKFLEPTAVHAGDLCPYEFRELSVDELRAVSREKLEMAWSFGAAALLTRLLSGKARRISHSSPANQPELQSCLVGAIEAAARRSDENIPNESRAKIVELVTQGLAANRSERPPFHQLYEDLEKLAANFRT